MGDGSIDILMITHNRLAYTRLSLPRLLETCDESCRVWLWHNGTDEETLSVVRSYLDHPRIYKFHYSSENKMLREPTNWLWREAKGDLLGKVDDDCLLPAGWTNTLRRAHEEVEQFGMIGCWPFLLEDFMPDLAARKIRTFSGGHRLLHNLWIGGSGYLMKREVVQQIGGLRERESFASYCIRAAAKHWINGWYFPFICQDHMDDPRSRYTLMRSEEEFRRCRGLSAQRFGIDSLAMLKERARLAAIEVQQASTDLSDYVGWRALSRRVLRRVIGKARIARFDA
jgi:hypothetical protein